MDTAVNIFSSIFDLLTDTTLLGLPLIVWCVIPPLFTLIVKFIKGDKK